MTCLRSVVPRQPQIAGIGRPCVAQRVAWILGGAGALRSGIAAFVPPDELSHLWEVLMP